MDNEDGERYLEPDELGEYQVPFDGKCWWCGKENLTGEHKFKQTDLRKMFGTDPDTELIFFSSDGHVSYVRGPNSAVVKFDKNLCAECNNARSQRFDRAWDDMSEYIRANWPSLKAGVSIRLSDVYPHPEERGIADLTRYVVKHFGCKIAASLLPVPLDLPRYLDDPNSVESVQIAMFYSEGRAQMQHAIDQDGLTGSGSSMLTNGPLIATLSRSRQVPTDFVTELLLGPIGFLVKWCDWQTAERPLHRAEYAALYDRREMPYLEIHDARPDLGEARKFMRDNPSKESRAVDSDNA